MDSVSLCVILLSFRQDYSLMTGEFSGIGLGNYAEIFHDANFLNGLRNTALYVLFVVPIVTVLSLFLASLLNSCTKLQGLFQTCYFLPMVTSVTAVGLVWKWMFNYDYGLINYALSLFGVSPVNWLNDPHYNLAALIIYGIWSMLPFTIILLLSGFQNINPQYYTAARIDGATNLQIFTKITLPLSKPMIVYTALTQFAWPWSDYLLPKLLLKNRDQWTVAVGLFSMPETHFSRFAAGSVFIAVPIVILYFCLVKHIVNGLTAGAVKG